MRRLTGDVGTDSTHGDANIGRTQGRCVVDAVSGHCNKLTLFLQCPDNPDLLLRRHPRIDPNRLHLPFEFFQTHCSEFGAGQHCAVGLGNPQPHCDGTGRGRMVSGNHDRSDTGTPAKLYGLPRLGPRRVHQTHQPEEAKFGFNGLGIEVGGSRLKKTKRQRQHP